MTVAIRKKRLEFTHFLSVEMRRTRMDKGWSAFRDVVFGVSRPKRLSVVGGADGNLTVAWTKGGESDTYAVTPVYSVFGSEVEGEPISCTVESAPQGLMIIVK